MMHSLLGWHLLWYLASVSHERFFIPDSAIKAMGAFGYEQTQWQTYDTLLSDTQGTGCHHFQYRGGHGKPRPLLNYPFQKKLVLLTLRQV